MIDISIVSSRLSDHRARICDCLSEDIEQSSQGFQNILAVMSRYAREEVQVSSRGCLNILARMLEFDRGGGLLL